MAGGFDRPLREVHCVDEGPVLVPFCFTINGSSNPDAVLGDIVTSQTVTRTSAGLFTFTMYSLPYTVIGGSVSCSSGAAEDIVPHLDASLANTTGVVTVRTMTGTTPTDPSDNAIVYGILFCKRTDRRAGA